MTAYRVLNCESGTYVRLDTGPIEHEHSLVTVLTTTSAQDVHRVRRSIARQHPEVRYVVLSSDDDPNIGGNWPVLAMRNSDRGEYRYNPSAPNARTNNGLLNPRAPEHVVGPQCDGITPDDDEEDEEECPYCLRPDSECEECFHCGDCECDGLMCLRDCYSCGWESPHEDDFTVYDGDRVCLDCHDERTMYEGRPGISRRRCSRCHSDNVHHDDLSERFVCDHEARELLAARKPVTLSHPLPELEAV